MKTISMVLALLSPVALAEFVPTEQVTSQDGTIACTMNAATIETEQTQDGPVVLFTFVCLNRISKDMGSEKVMVFCESGEVVGLSAAAIGSDGEPRPVPPTERKGIVVGSTLENGVAKECARAVLPMATQTRLYMTGSVRSWIHYIQLRTQQDTQFEHREIAETCKVIFIEQLPTVSEALGWL